jgi:hypothetical protein
MQPQDLGKNGKHDYVSYCTSWAANWLNELWAPAAAKAKEKETKPKASLLPSVIAGGVFAEISGGKGEYDLESVEDAARLLLLRALGKASF